MHNTTDIIQELESVDSISVEKSFQLAQICNSLISANNIDGNKIAINILNNWRKIPVNTHELWTNIFEIAGFYPYIVKEHLTLNNTVSELRQGLHESSHLPSKFFHDEQLEILNILNKGKNVVVSAPTSFGKSLLIEEIVASNQFKNIVVIQPTLALLDETRKNLMKYNDKYKLIVRTSQEPNKEIGNIYLFTAERVNEYKYFASVDFLIIDEFYKLSGQRDDERSSSLNNAFYRIINRFHPRFNLLGPNIDEISHGFEEAFNAVFYRSKYILVDSQQIDIYKDHEGEFGDRGKKRHYKEKVLFDLLVSLRNEQNIIYCSSPNRVRYLAKTFAEYLKSINMTTSQITYPISEWIKINISEDWMLLRGLEFDIGIHDGALQKHITSSIIEYFNTDKIKYLFCTSTIIEGVNTSAKNIIYFDAYKGKNVPIDYFDYSNIKGRAGRMMQHYVGRIYNFNPPPQVNETIIDIPFFQQNPIKDEVLIQLDSNSVRNKEAEQYKNILTIPSEEREIIKHNGLSVYGQKRIIDILSADIDTKYDLIAWATPKYKQLSYILGLAWDNLIQPTETVKPMTKDHLIHLTFDYGLNKDIYKLVNDRFTYLHTLERYADCDQSEIRDEAIQFIFQTMKHWFQYKVPKWLSTLNELQKYVCQKHHVRAGNYIPYANAIENDFIRENLSILSEYGIPSSAIRKIESKIPTEIEQDNVFEFIRQNRLHLESELIEYEKEKFLQNI